MQRTRGIKFFFLTLVMLFSCMGHNASQEASVNGVENRFVFYECSPQQIILKWKDANGNILGSLENFKSEVEREGRQLKFAMNAGMYLEDQSPQGLYIENGHMFKSLNTKKGSANFYLLPNGVFYINQQQQAAVVTTTAFTDTAQVKFATQSGPMLLIDGKIHPEFREGSTNVHLRNGLGILPNGNVLLAISTEKVNFFDFAKFFLNKGCKQALYLDGYVSRAFGPSVGLDDLGGDFGVMLGVIDSTKK
jgi:uncharacterized protein YigE (DUF2233 family)